MGQFERYSWDDEKDKENRAKHGLPLIYVRHLFNDPYLIIHEGKEDRNTGEKRYLAVRLIDKNVLSCVYSERAGFIRLISLHKQSGRMRREYQ
jgi:uncharacterized DUF497 family protein